MRAIDPRLLRRARSSSGLLLVCIAIGLGIAACVLGQAVTLAAAISRVFLGGADLHHISTLLVIAGRPDGDAGGAGISPRDGSGAGICSCEIATAARPDAPRG